MSDGNWQLDLLDTGTDLETEEVRIEYCIVVKDLGHSLRNTDRQTRDYIGNLIGQGYSVYSRAQIILPGKKIGNISTKNTVVSLFLVSKDEDFSVCIFHPEKNTAPNIKDLIDEISFNILLARLCAPGGKELVDISEITNKVVHIVDLLQPVKVFAEA